MGALSFLRKLWVYWILFSLLFAGCGGLFDQKEEIQAKPMGTSGDSSGQDSNERKNSDPNNPNNPNLPNPPSSPNPNPDPNPNPNPNPNEPPILNPPTNPIASPQKEFFMCSGPKMQMQPLMFGLFNMNSSLNFGSLDFLRSDNQKILDVNQYLFTKDYLYIVTGPVMNPTMMDKTRLYRFEWTENFQIKKQSQILLAEYTDDSKLFLNPKGVFLITGAQKRVLFLDFQTINSINDISILKLAADRFQPWPNSAQAMKLKDFPELNNYDQMLISPQANRLVFVSTLPANNSDQSTLIKWVVFPKETAAAPKIIQFSLSGRYQKHQWIQSHLAVSTLQVNMKKERKQTLSVMSVSPEGTQQNLTHPFLIPEPGVWSVFSMSPTDYRIAVASETYSVLEDSIRLKSGELLFYHSVDLSSWKLQKHVGYHNYVFTKNILTQNQVIQSLLWNTEGTVLLMGTGHFGTYRFSAAQGSIDWVSEKLSINTPDDRCFDLQKSGGL